MSTFLLQTLPVVCGSCDHLNDPGTTACKGCGTSVFGPHAAVAHLAPAGPAPAQPSSPPKPAAPPVPAPISAVELVKKEAPAPPATDFVRSLPASPAGSTAPTTPAKPQASRFGLTVLAGHSQGQRYRLAGPGCMIGRSRGSILFPEDTCVSPHHATLVLKDGALFVRDEASASGVFVSIRAPETIFPLALFSAGQRLFRFLGPIEPSVRWPPGSPLVYGAPVPPGQFLFGLEEILMGARPGRTVIGPGPVFSIGQTSCDLSYPGDEYLAGRHLELTATPQGAALRDCSGGRGTYVGIGPGRERPLLPGDRIRIGQELLQVEQVA